MVWVASRHQFALHASAEPGVFKNSGAPMPENVYFLLSFF
jgi:hypothetical protein